eukprot:COSAG05_NODE_18629_length_305_cov_0.956311_1_plen_28_part_10
MTGAEQSQGSHEMLRKQHTVYVAEDVMD